MRSVHRCLVNKGVGLAEIISSSVRCVPLFSYSNRIGAWHMTSQLHYISQSPATHVTKFLTMEYKPLVRQSLSETELNAFMLFFSFPQVQWNTGIRLWQRRWGQQFKLDKEELKILSPWLIWWSRGVHQFGTKLILSEIKLYFMWAIIFDGLFVIIAGIMLILLC